MSLRLRLFFTHTIVIMIAFIVLGAALAILMIDYQQRLMLRELSFVATTVVRSLRLADITDNTDKVLERLAIIGQNQRFQVALLDSNGVIQPDHGFAADAAVAGHKLDLSHKVSVLGEVSATTTNNREQLAASVFTDGQRRRWTFVAIAIRPTLASTSWLIIARPFLSGPVVSLQDEGLALPFIEAGGVALILAAVLAALVARSIAGPIQKVAAAANAIKRGQYDQRAAISGPVEVRQLADDFNQMAARVQTAQKTEHDFVANVSHELKTPLTSIKGFAQAIEDGTVSDEASIKSAARIINDEADRLTRLVVGLLDSARLEAGDIKMSMHPIQINAIINSSLAKFAPRADNSEIQLIANLTDQSSIQADGDRMAQVVTNLLDNAIKHTLRGGKVSVESRMMPASKTCAAGIEFSVIDTGKGIPAEDLPRIFERFYQVDKARVQSDGTSLSGAGLGLAICKQIIDAHHGTITAQSVVGIGTRINVWLPASQPV